MASKRPNPTETFQPTRENSQHLAPLKTQRGLKSETINKALSAFFNPKEKPLVDTLRRVLVDMHSDKGASQRDLRVLCEVCGLDIKKLVN